MRTIIGLDAKLYRNTGTKQTPTWTELTNIKDLTLALEKGEADVTTRASQGWEQTVATKKSASIEFEMVWDPDDEGFQAIKDAFFNNTTIEIAALDGPATPAAGETSQGLRAICNVTRFTRKEPLEEALTVDVTLKPAYGTAPTWMINTGT